jgi:GT2 family glycosyltransferase
MTESSDKKIVPVTVVVVSFNTRELTRKAILALRDSVVLPEEIIVVDNNSTDGSKEMITEDFPEIRLVTNSENLGFARANNLAIGLAKEAKYVWLLNSDTEAGLKTLGELYDYMEANEKIGALEPQLVYPDSSGQSVGGFFPGILNVFLYLLPLFYFFPASFKRRLKSLALYPQELPVVGLELDYVTGAAMFLRKAALDQVGLLGEDYFMYFEETDLCWRLGRAGWQVRAIKTDPVMHVYGGSYKGRYDAKRLKIFLDSLKIFVKKYYSGPRKYIILAEVFLLGRLSLWIKQHKNF